MALTHSLPEPDADCRDDRRTALTYLTEAFAEAVLDGVDEDSLVQAALFTALSTLVDTYGEDAAAVFTARLPERVRHGEFSIATRQ